MEMPVRRPGGMSCCRLVVVLMCLCVPGTSPADLTMLDYKGRATGKCCVQSDACRSVESLADCTRSLCDCDTMDMDFGFSGLGATLENGLQDLGGSIAVSPNGKLMGIAGKGGAWASRSDTLGQALYDQNVKDILYEPSARVSAAAGDELVCFSLQSRVICMHPSATQDSTGSLWRDVLNTNLPPAWSMQWGSGNFLMNTILYQSDYCPHACDKCFTERYGTPYAGHSSSVCYGIAVSIDGSAVAISGLEFSRTNANDQHVYKGFVHIRIAEAADADGVRRWRQDAAAHLSIDNPSFGQSVSLRGRLLVVGAPTMNEDDLWLDGIDFPGSVKIYHGTPACPTGVGCNYAPVPHHTLSAPYGSSNFGAEVWIDDKTLLVGAPGNATVRVSASMARECCFARLATVEECVTEWRLSRTRTLA